MQGFKHLFSRKVQKKIWRSIKKIE